jgi:AcrR family transcriptional regulator
MSDGFQRRREQSKEDIRKASRELFGRYGIEKVSIADIARTAGVSQATIYNNYGSKDALVREFVAGVIDDLTARVEAILAPPQPFWDKVSSLIAFTAGMMAENRPSEADIMLYSDRGLLDDPEIKRIRDAAEERVRELLLGLVAEGKAEGEIPVDLSDTAFRIYFKAFMDVFSGARFGLLDQSDPKLVQDLGRLMIFGMHGPPAVH